MYQNREKIVEPHIRQRFRKIIPILLQPTTVFCIMSQSREGEESCWPIVSCRAVEAGA